MSTESATTSGWYFALPRLCLFLCKRSAKRSENNWIEAYVVGVLFFLLSYATLLAHLQVNAFSAIALLFVTWILWVLALYLNSVIIRALRIVGAFRGLTNSRAQNIVIGTEMMICALLLIVHSPWPLLGWMCVAISALNVIAAVILIGRDA